MRPRPFSPVQGIVTVLALGWSDFILKYRGSVLGYFWSLVNPLVKFVVILYIFGPYVSPSIPQYPLYLFLGIIIWEHFATTTTACMNMLFEKSQIIRHLPFPKILLILSVGWTNLLIFSTHALIFLAFAWSRGAALSFSTLYMPVIIIQMTLLSLGIGMVLASYALRYRDLPHLWTVMVQLFFWLTPVMYPYTAEAPILTRLGSAITGEGFRTPMALFRLFIETQPLAIIINDARRACLYAVHSMPSPGHVVGITLVCCVVFLLGTALFQRRSPSFSQEY
ncbi:MAG: ABC transporter permease [Candidatus Peribacteraceae bacterium]|nr:ABC transporter permease [Candidatus Peribacteraceae bacterium]